jgi:hypothetical protein
MGVMAGAQKLEVEDPLRVIEVTGALSVLLASGS